MKYWNKETITRIRKGYYSAVYFNRTKEILLSERNQTVVTMQIFQKNKDAVLCGIGEVIELLRSASGFWEKRTWKDRWKELRVETLRDGDDAGSKEPVMHINGQYLYFAHLESLYLGILARRTLVATNTRRMVEAARGKPVVFFADRFDHFFNQEGDGYAARVGGAYGVCTPAHALCWSRPPVGTIPHALIAVHNGNTVEAARQFIQYFPKVPLIVLVDYDNDCVGTSLTVAKALGNTLWGVRLDTSESEIDVSLQKTKGSDIHGVTPKLVENVRTALTQSGYPGVKIVVSGGFSRDKIRLFEQKKAPVDLYGVGSAILKGNNDFTADIVRVNGRSQAKAGRSYLQNNRMHGIT